MSTESQTRIREQEARDEKRRLWLERVEKEIESAEAWTPAKRPDALAKRLDNMVEMWDKAEILSQPDKTEIRDRARQTKLRTYEKYLDHLLETTMAATRDKDRQKEKNDLLKEWNETLTIAIRLGTTQALKDTVKERLDIIRQTTVAGDSSKAKEAADREAKRRETVHPQEHRTFTRWRDPPLVVVIDGRTYTTVDWSLGGLLVADIPDRGWQPRQQVDIKVGLSADKLHAERIEIVRYIPETSRLAIKSRRFASVLMQIKRERDAAGRDPAS